MKKEIHKIWGVGLTLVLVISLLAFAAPVSAGELSWTTETIPSATGNVLETSSNITDLDVADDGTMYASSNTTILWKSTNGGVTWSGKTPPDNCDANLVAVAPDNSDVIAFWDSDNLTVYVSTNGATTWGSLGKPAEGSAANATAINDIAISPTADGNNFLAVAGQESGGAANVWWFEIGAAAPAWKETNDKAGYTTTSSMVLGAAVAFSPNFASDKVLTAVTATTAKAEFQMFSLSTKVWNVSAGFADYPVNIQNGTSDIENVSEASITLSPDYLGSDDTLRIAFVGIGTNVAATEGGVYRLKNITDKAIDDGINIHSIDYDGVNLVAGTTASHNVRRSDDALATTPTFSSASSLKRPGGPTTYDVLVAWNGADVAAGTAGLSSAFSVSRDNGYSFNDLSLVDTLAATLGTLLDVAVSADGSNVYLLANDTNALSLWRKSSSWERVFSIATSADYIVRVAPDDPDTVYLALTGTGAKTVYYSGTAGETKWFQRASRYDIQDLAVEGDGDVAYIAVSSTNTVSKTTNTGFTWGTAKSSGVTGNIHMIASLSEDNLIVGSVSGYVAWSTDGNSSWTDLSKRLGDGSTVTNASITASGLATDDYIYASAKTAVGTDSLVERWQIGQTATTWKSLAATFDNTDNLTATGIALVEGVLYVMTEDVDGDDSQVLRTLSPTAAEPSASKWCTLTSAGESFYASPSALRVSTGSTKLWAVNTIAPALWSYTDTLATVGPALVAPAHGTEVQINPVSGVAYDVSFSWERPSKANKYQIQISLDYEFDEVVNATTTVESTDPVIAHVEAGSTFMPETDYYWRVRVYTNDPKPYSPYSAVRMISIAALPEAFAPVIVEQPPAPVIQVPPAPAITITPPEIVLPAPPPAPPAIVIPPAPAPPAPITPAYIWAIIIIGAILVIAVIILIVRTRRPV